MYNNATNQSIKQKQTNKKCNHQHLSERQFLRHDVSKRFLLRKLSTRPLPDEPRLPQNETSDTRNCDRQCRDDFGIRMKSNTNEEEAGRTRFRLIEMSARRLKSILVIVTLFASVSYSCKSWRVPIRGSINAKPNSPGDQIVPATK